MTISVDVHNAGDIDAVDVVQLYLHQRHGTSARPVRELKGFETIGVPAGETRRVEFEVGSVQRRYWSTATGDWTLDATAFDVWVGGDSTADLHTEFTVTDR